MSQPEAKTKEAIKDVIDGLWPVNFHLMPVAGLFGKNGIPDHLACVPVIITQEMVGKSYGMFVGVEAKTETGKFKGIQKVRCAEIIKADGFAQVVFGPEGAVKLKQQLMKRFEL